MQTKTNEITIPFFSSIFISIAWITGSVVLTIYLQWPAEQLAKAFYILITYSLFGVITECVAWYLKDIFETEQDLLNDTEIKFFDSGEFIGFPILGIALFLIHFPKALSTRLDG